MAEIRLKISDGTTIVDLIGGNDSIARHGGVSMPPPRVKESYVSSPFRHGAQLAASEYDNRRVNK